jgi:hypothetical protein
MSSARLGYQKSRELFALNFVECAVWFIIENAPVFSPRCSFRDGHSGSRAIRKGNLEYDMLGPSRLDTACIEHNEGPSPIEGPSRTR